MPTLSSFTILPNAPGLAGKVRFTMTHCKGKPIKKKKKTSKGKYNNITKGLLYMVLIFRRFYKVKKIIITFNSFNNIYHKVYKP